MKQTRKRFTHVPKGHAKFKDMIVAQLKDGARVIDLSRLYNISDKTIQQWKSDSLKWKDKVLEEYEEGARKKVLVPFRVFYAKLQQFKERKC